MFAIDYRLKRNPKILNARPNPWRRLSGPRELETAQAEIAKLRSGAKEANIPYLYRLVRL